MNILPGAFSAHLFASREDYLSFRRHWCELMKSSRKHELSAAHHLLYLTVLGKDWRKAFTPPTNSQKLANGAFQGWKLFRAWEQIHQDSHKSWLLAPFDGLLTNAMLRTARQWLPASINRYTMKPFAGQAYPFEAYSAQVVTAVLAPAREQSNV